MTWFEPSSGARRTVMTLVSPAVASMCRTLPETNALDANDSAAAARPSEAVRTATAGTTRRGERWLPYMTLRTPPCAVCSAAAVRGRLHRLRTQASLRTCGKLDQSFFAAESDFLSELDDDPLSDFSVAFSRARLRVP